MDREITLVASLTTDPERVLAELPPEVGMLEVRADRAGDVDVDWLRDRFAGRLLYTIRSRAEGGEASDSAARRGERLAAAAARYDLVDLEAARDLVEETLEKVPAEKRLVSWHGEAADPNDLRDRFDTLAATPAALYKMIPEALQSGDGIRTLAFLESLDRDDVVAFCTSEIGSWTRVVAAQLGSPLVFGSVGDAPAAPGQIPIERLVSDYGMPRIRRAEHLFGLVGRPVSHSLSPRLHNGAYAALDIPALYVAFHAESFGDFWLEIVESESFSQLGIPFQGFSVTAPYKEVALAVSGASSPRAQHIGAANTLVINGDVWEAESTDPEGVVGALFAEDVAVRGVRAAVVGCGGAGKAAAYGLELAGADVTLVNRNRERGEHAAIELRLPFVPLARFDPGGYDVVVQATSLGAEPGDPLPFPAEGLDADATLVELVYVAGRTPLARAAIDRGVRVIGGRRVLLHQALGQFRLMTKRTLDEDLARKILGLGGEQGK